MNNAYQSFVENVLKEKEFLIMLCLKDLKEPQEEIGPLYEMGILSLFYVHQLYQSKQIYHENFDFLAYHFMLYVMCHYIHKDDKLKA